VFQKKHIR